MRSPFALVLAALALSAVTACTANDGDSEEVGPGRDGQQQPGDPTPGLQTDPAVAPTTTPGPTQSAGTSIRPTTSPGFDGSDRGNSGS